MLGAAVLKDETIAAWNLYVEATEQRIAEELAGGDDRFLGLDFTEESGRRARGRAGGRGAHRANGDARSRRRAHPSPARDYPPLARECADPGSQDVLHGLIVAIEPSELQPDVLESRVIERDGDRLHLFLRLRRRQQMVTVDYNSEHRAEYTRHGPDTASSRSWATRIAELENVGSPDEGEKPVGRDRGFLWRLRTYWRYEQVDEGVIAECESVALSRGIPRLVSWMVRPLVNRAVREVLGETLTSMSTVLSAAAPFDDVTPSVQRAEGP